MLYRLRKLSKTAEVRCCTDRHFTLISLLSIKVVPLRDDSCPLCYSSGALRASGLLCMDAAQKQQLLSAFRSGT